MFVYRNKSRYCLELGHIHIKSGRLHFYVETQDYSVNEVPALIFVFESHKMRNTKKCQVTGQDIQNDRPYQTKVLLLFSH